MLVIALLKFFSTSKDQPIKELVFKIIELILLKDIIILSLEVQVAEVILPLLQLPLEKLTLFNLETLSVPLLKNSEQLLMLLLN